MMYTAESKNLKMSPRKVRLVVEGIKNMPILSALSVLAVDSTRASGPIRKVIQSAIANAVHNGKENKDNLIISEMFVNEGISYKRFHFAGRGRTRPYKKRTSHLKVILKVKDKVALSAVAEVKEKEKVMKKEIKEGESK